MISISYKTHYQAGGGNGIFSIILSIYSNRGKIHYHRYQPLPGFHYQVFDCEQKILQDGNGNLVMLVMSYISYCKYSFYFLLPW